MAFTMINGMRSHRYPLAAADCGCGSLGRTPARLPASGMGLDVESAAFGGSVVAAAGGGLLIGLFTGWWLGKTFGRSSAVLVNRRRRAR